MQQWELCNNLPNYFQLHPKDGLPPYMCMNCIEHVEDMYEFHLECEDSERNFLWLLSVRWFVANEHPNEGLDWIVKKWDIFNISQKKTFVN